VEVNVENIDARGDEASYGDGRRKVPKRTTSVVRSPRPIPREEEKERARVGRNVENYGRTLLESSVWGHGR